MPAAPVPAAILGWIGGIVMTLTFGAITWYTSSLLADAMVIKGVRHRTYQSAVEAVFGRRGGILLAAVQYPNLCLTAIACEYVLQRMDAGTLGVLRTQRSGGQRRAQSLLGSLPAHWECFARSKVAGSGTPCSTSLLVSPLLIYAHAANTLCRQHHGGEFRVQGVAATPSVPC